MHAVLYLYPTRLVNSSISKQYVPYIFLPSTFYKKVTEEGRFTNPSQDNEDTLENKSNL